jgi:hypothetical protein
MNRDFQRLVDANIRRGFLDTPLDVVNAINTNLGLDPLDSSLPWEGRDSQVESTFRVYMLTAPDTPALLFLRALRALGAAAGDAIVPSNATPSEMATATWEACSRAEQAGDSATNRPLSDGTRVSYRTGSGRVALEYLAGGEVRIAITPYGEGGLPKTVDLWRDRQGAVALLSTLADAMALADRELMEGLGEEYRESPRVTAIRRLAQALEKRGEV